MSRKVLFYKGKLYFSADTVYVPTKLSQLQNDVGYVTTDNKVEQEGGFVDNDDFEILFSGEAGDNNYTGLVRKNSCLKFNPYGGNLTLSDLSHRVSIIGGGTSNISVLQASDGLSATTNRQWIDISPTDIVINGSDDVAAASRTWDGTNTSLKLALKGKVNKAGDTMTGDLLFANSETNFRQIKWTVGNNDYGRIGCGASEANAGYMEIATADDGNEPIYVRQYSGNYTTVSRTAELLDGSGNTSFPRKVRCFGISDSNTAASAFFTTGALEIREAGGVGSAQASFNYAPRIGFHWSNRIAATLSFHSDGIFYFRKQNGTERATIDANVNGTATSATDSTKLPLSGGTLTGSMNAKFSNIDASKANNNVSSTQYPTTYCILDTSNRILSRLESVIESNGNIGTFMYVRNYNTSGSLVAQKGLKMTMNKSGTLTWGIDDRLQFLKTLTNENVGTSSQYFLTITDSWGKGGYCTVADAKTVLGLGSAAYTNSSAYASSSHNHTYLTSAGSNTASSKTSDYALGSFNVRFFNETGKLPGQPGQYGFLLTLATGTNAAENHQIFAIQANGDLYHRGTNGSSYKSPPAFRKILDDGNYNSYALPLSGGTLTGNLYFSGGKRPMTPIISRSDTSDSGYVGFVNTANSAYTPIKASAFTTSSSKHIKENIEDISDEDAMKLMDIRPVNFDYIKEVGGGKNNVGVLAEDTYKLLPKVVYMPEDYVEEEFDVSKGINQPIPNVDYAKFVPYLIKMVQIQQREIDELKEICANCTKNN